MNRLRVLLLGPDCDPERVSIPLVTYCHAAALADLHDVTLVAKSSVEPALRRANAPFRKIEVIHTPKLDRAFAWSFRNIFNSNYDSQVVTAFKYPFSIAFEWTAWRQLRDRIFSGQFDVVLRLVPMSPALPSPFAFFLRRGPIPFVIGPLNGGLPWPSGFGQLKMQREWIASLRDVYRYLPFARSTYKYAAAIIAASSQTFSEFREYSEKLFFVPEPGIGASVCSDGARVPSPETKLKLIFVGGLVPRKACDLALRGAAKLLHDDLAHFKVIGDGPERNRLELLAESLGIKNHVSFCGWLSHKDVLEELQTADVMVFPSIRDNGAGVVFEALASGAVPIVVDFGGPGDIVHSEVGYKIPLTNESDMVAKISNCLQKLAGDRELLLLLRSQGIRYARESLTWDAKAHSTSRVLNWVIGKGIKPDLLPPKMLEIEALGED